MTPNHKLAEKLGYRIEKTSGTERFQNGTEYRWYIIAPGQKKKYFERIDDVNAWLEYLEDDKAAQKGAGI